MCLGEFLTILMMHDVIYDILEPSSFQKHGTCWVFSALLSLSLSLSLLSWSLSKLISYAYCLNAYMDIMLRRASKPLYMNIFFLEVLFYPGFLFVFVFVCVFVIVNMCQEAVGIINFPKIYKRMGF